MKIVKKLITDERDEITFEVNVDKMQFIFNDGKNKFRMSLSREEVMVFTGQIHEYLDNKSEIV